MRTSEEKQVVMCIVNETAYEMTREINMDEVRKKRAEKSGIKFGGAYFCKVEEAE